MQAPYAYKRLWLMRHGETFASEGQAQVSRQHEAALTPAGVAQIEQLAVSLKTLTFDAIYASGMACTLQTAHILCAGRPLRVEAEPDLQEMPLAVGPEATYREVALAYIDLCRQLAQHDPDRVLLPGGVSFGALSRRYLAALHRIMQQPHVHKALVIAHGGVNRMLLCACLGVPYTQMLCFEQDPGWVNIIDFAKRGRPFVRLINATLSDPWKETAAFRQPVGG